MWNFRLILIIIAQLPLRSLAMMTKSTLLQILEPNIFQARWKSQKEGENVFDFFDDVEQGNVEVNFKSPEMSLENHAYFSFQTTEYIETKNVQDIMNLKCIIQIICRSWSGTSEIDLVGQQSFKTVWKKICSIKYVILVMFPNQFFDAANAQILIYLSSNSPSDYCNFELQFLAYLKNEDYTKDINSYYYTFLILTFIWIGVIGTFLYRIEKYRYVMKKSFYFQTFWKFNVGSYFGIYLTFCFISFQFEKYGDSIIVWHVYSISIYQVVIFFQLATHFPVLRERLKIRFPSEESQARIVAALGILFLVSPPVNFLFFYFLPYKLKINFPSYLFQRKKKQRFYHKYQVMKKMLFQYHLLLYQNINFLKLNYFECLIITFSFILLPEIIYNVKYNTKPYFNFLSFYIQLFPEVFLMIYLKGCPTNIFSTQPNYIVLSFFLIIILLSLIILLLQNIFGPRFQMIKEKKQKLWKCFVCQNSLRYSQSQVRFEKIYIPIETTLCNHMFHQICLDEWRQSNNVCPECEADL